MPIALLVAVLSPVLLAAAAGLGPVSDQPPASSRTRDRDFLVTGSAGVAIPNGSEQADALAVDGVDRGLGLHLELSGAVYFGFPLGIGAYTGLTSINSRASDTAPNFNEQRTHIGLQAPVIAPLTDQWLLVLGPRAGVVFGSQSFSGDAHLQPSMEFGGALGLYLRASRRGYLGLGVTYMRAPGDPPADLARSHDWGGLTLGISGAIDG